MGQSLRNRKNRSVKAAAFEAATAARTKATGSVGLRKKSQIRAGDVLASAGGCVFTLDSPGLFLSNVKISGGRARSGSGLAVRLTFVILMCFIQR